MTDILDVYVLTNVLFQDYFADSDYLLPIPKPAKGIVCEASSMTFPGMLLKMDLLLNSWIFISFSSMKLFF